MTTRFTREFFAEVDRRLAEMLALLNETAADDEIRAYAEQFVRFGMDNGESITNAVYWSLDRGNPRTVIYDPQITTPQCDYPTFSGYFPTQMEVLGLMTEPARRDLCELLPLIPHLAFGADTSNRLRAAKAKTKGLVEDYLERRGLLSSGNAKKRNRSAEGGEGRANSAEPTSESGAKLPSGFLGGASLGAALGVPQSRRDAFLKQLERKRTTLGDDNWLEAAEPRPNAPRYHYRADAPAVIAIAAEYSRQKPA